jgi:hypothetical protein
VGVALSSAGLGLVVFAILRSSAWGFVQPRTPLTIGGTEITPLGFSVVPFMVLGGLGLLWAFTGGLLASQLGNVIMSSVLPTQTSEAGGLQGTAQNLGSSLGTAIVGAVLLASLATGFSERIVANPAVPAAAREQIVANTEQGIDIVPVAAAEQAAADGGLTPDQARAVAADYGAAQLDALRLSLGAVALAALLSLSLTRRLPTAALARGEVGAAEPVVVA